MQARIYSADDCCSASAPVCARGGAEAERHGGAHGAAAEHVDASAARECGGICFGRFHLVEAVGLFKQPLEYILHGVGGIGLVSQYPRRQAVELRPLRQI